MEWLAGRLVLVRQLAALRADCRRLGAVRLAAAEMVVQGLAESPATPACSTATSSCSAGCWSNFPGGQIVGQPLPALPRTDDRYELLAKLQGVLRSLHFDGILVLVDRVDEPYLINGSTDLMRALGLADVGQQVPQASGPGAETAAADRVGAAGRPRRPRLPPAGPAGQAEPHPLAELDRPIALRHGQRPDRRLRRRRQFAEDHRPVRGRSTSGV